MRDGTPRRPMACAKGTHNKLLRLNIQPRYRMPRRGSWPTLRPEASRLVDSRAAYDRADNLDVLDLPFVHREKIVGQHNEVRQFARCDRSFDRLLMRVVSAVDRINPQGFVDTDPLVSSPGLSVPTGARHHSLNGHPRVERSGTEVRSRRHRNSGILETAIGHAPPHEIFAVKFELVGVVIGIRRERR